MSGVHDMTDYEKLITMLQELWKVEPETSFEIEYEKKQDGTEDLSDVKNIIVMTGWMKRFY